MLQVARSRRVLLGALLAAAFFSSGPNCGHATLRLAADARAGLDVGFSAGQLSFPIATVRGQDLNIDILSNPLLANEPQLEGARRAVPLAVPGAPGDPAGGVGCARACVPPSSVQRARDAEPPRATTVLLDR